jgi:hypothetical protein
MSTYTTRRLGLWAGVAALAAGGVVAAAGPAAASSGQVDVAVSTDAGLQVAMQWDGAPSSAWTIETVAAGGDWGTPSLFRQKSGNLVLTAVDGDGSLWFWWQGAGATGWSAPQEVAGPGSAYWYGQPAIASQYTVETGEQADTVIVSQDPGDYGAMYYWEAAGGTTWHSGKLPTPDGVAIQPDVTVTADNTVLVSYDTDADPEITSSPGFAIDQLPFNSTSWSILTWIDTNTGDLPDNAVIEQPNGNLVVGASDVSGDSYFFWSPAGHPSVWYQESVGTNDIHLSINPEYIQPMTITGNDQGMALGAQSASVKCITAESQPNGGTVWSTQTIGCPGGSGITYPAALVGDQAGTYNTTAATVDPEGGAYFSWQTYGATGWNAEKIPGISDVSVYTDAALAAD